MPAPQLSNYVLETATAPGTGSFTLNGPEADRRSFEAAFISGALVFYFADDGASAEWGLGTLTVGTPSVLARTTVLGNTANTRAALNFPGTVEVYNEIPAEFMPVLGQDGGLALTGPLIVKGQSVVLSGGGAGILQATIDAGTGSPSFMDGAGGWHPVQPYGSYATAAQLDAEITRASTIESNLQGSKVSRSGDTMTGALSVQAAGGVSAAFDPGGQTNGAFVNYAPVQSVALGRGGSFGLYVQEQVGSAFNGVLAVSYPGGTYRAVGIPQGGRMTDSLYGAIAYISDLGSFATQSQLPKGGTAGNGYYTVTGGIMDLVFTITFNTAGGQWVKFPIEFSGTPNVFACSDGSRDGQTDTDWFVWGRAKDGFYFNSRNHQGSFQINAKGPA